MRVGHATAAVVAVLEELSTAGWEAELASLEGAAADLRAALTPVRRSPPVVAVVGRTRAGKSTLRFVLTGDGEDGIGRGGQRTTRTIIEYAWHGLLLRDTPGVGARDGAADTALAMQAAATADLVLWVVTSDGLQKATVEPVRHIISRGVPVLVAVNHKEQHDLREDRNWSSEVLLTECELRDRRVRDVLAGTVGATVEVMHVQLDVGRWSRGAEGRDRAWVASGLPLLQQAIEAAAWRAEAARAVTRRAHQVAGLSAADTALQLLQAELEAALHVQDVLIAQHKERMAAEQKDWRNNMAAAQLRARDMISAQLEAAVRLAQATEHRAQATAAWRQAVHNVDAEVTAHLTAAAQRGLEAHHVHDDEPLVLVAAALTVASDELAGDPLTARGARTTLNVLKVAAGAAPFFVLGPFGAIVTSVVAPMLTEAVGGGVGPQLTGEQRKRADSLAAARAQAESALHLRLQALRSSADAVHVARVGGPARWTAVRLTARHEQLERQRIAVTRARTAVGEALDDH